MKIQGFTLIELVIVIVILGILAATAAPKFVDLSADARTATLQGVQAAMQSAAELVHNKSLVKGNQGQALTVTDSPTVNIGDGGGDNNDGEFPIHLGYPVANETEWQRLLNLDSTVFLYRNLGGTTGSSISIYRVDSNEPTTLTAPCTVLYELPTQAGAAPTFTLNPCQ